MCRVKIADEILLAQKGELLSEVLIKYNKKVEHPCGGKGTCGKCKVLVDGREELSCRYIVQSDISVDILEQNEVVSYSGAKEDINATISRNLCWCLDIGTTTLAIALVDVDNESVVKVKTATNPQRILGADVMSRIDYCRNNGVGKLHSLLIDEVNAMMFGMGIKEKIPMYVAGNVTMLHTFFDTDCSSLGVSPYTAQFLDSKASTGKDIGLENVGAVVSLPSVHTFFGADLTAGVGYAKLPEKGKYNLLVDLGTNAEIVLYSENHAICTSAAAGPCFEGANISCGMSAVDGAICGCRKLEEDSYSFDVIGDCEPRGVCGTGLVDVIACLLEDGVIDETGYMKCEEYELATDVCVNQKDVRQYQLAKSAVYSAIKVIMNMEKISFEQIDTMYISGGFSSQINISNGVQTGLLPFELSDKCIVLNNSSLLGVIKFACNRTDFSEFISKAEYVDLSCESMFSELFIDNINFQKGCAN